MTTSLRLNKLLYTLPLIITSSLAVAQQGDGGAATGNVPATATNGDIAGASGQSTGIVRLSTGAIVAIAVVVSIVVVAGILTSTLFYQAKKRQWTLRETLRHSRRRVTTGLQKVMSPLTPHRMTFSPGPTKTKFSDKETRGLRGHGPSPLGMGKNKKNNGIGLDVDMESLTGKDKRRQMDLEKGEGNRVLITDKGHKPQKPSLNMNIPKTGRKIEETTPKTPMLSKFFGRD